MDNDILISAKRVLTCRAKAFLLNDKDANVVMNDYLNECDGDYDVNYIDFIEYAGKLGVMIPDCEGFCFDDATDTDMDSFLISEYYDAVADSKATNIMTIGHKSLKTYKVVVNRKCEIWKEEEYEALGRNLDEAIDKVRNGLVEPKSSEYKSETEERLSSKENFAMAECDTLMPDDNEYDYEEYAYVFEVLQDKCELIKKE